MEEVTDEPLYRDRVCGIDIGKAGMAATIRVPSDANPARRAQETRSFGTTKREVLALADWLRSWQVPAVVMEATGDYWKPVFYRLEAEGFECVLADAKQVKHLPGRPKRDPSDSRLLAATLFAHESAAFGVDVPAGLGGDLCWRRWSGWAVAGVVRPAEETGERRDGLEQQRVESGLLVGGALGVEAGDEPVPLGQGLVLVLGGLPAGLVACPPPAQRRGASYGGGAMVPGLGGEGGVHREWPGARPGTGGAGLVHGQSRVSSATAFLAQASSTRSLPAAAAAMSAAVAALFRARGSPLATRCSRAMASSASSGSSRPARAR